MAAVVPGPAGLIPAVRASHLTLARVLRELTDDEARAPSRLPGWSRGHVVTHLARNADGLRRMLVGAVEGRVAEMYEGGASARAAGIEAGAWRSGADLRADAIDAAERLDAVWDQVSAEVWANGRGAGVFGEIPMAEIVFRRLREVEVHSVDLGLNRFTVDDWSDSFVGSEWPQTVSALEARLPDGVRIALVRQEDLARTELGPAGVAVTVVEQPFRRLLGWLMGRFDVPNAPALKPW